jgi:hypothetical protein
MLKRGAAAALAQTAPAARFAAGVVGSGLMLA